MRIRHAEVVNLRIPRNIVPHGIINQLENSSIFEHLVGRINIQQRKDLRCIATKVSYHENEMYRISVKIFVEKVGYVHVLLVATLIYIEKIIDSNDCEYIIANKQILQDE